MTVACILDVVDGRNEVIFERMCYYNLYLQNGLIRF